jgi:hypothetical protein
MKLILTSSFLLGIYSGLQHAAERPSLRLING